MVFFDIRSLVSRIAPAGILVPALSVRGKLLITEGTKINSYAGRAVLVHGHTDNTGNPALNKDLSLRRAKSVAKWLVSNRFVDPSKMATDGRGQDQPVDSNNTTAGRARNLRVVLMLKR